MTLLGIDTTGIVTTAVLIKDGAISFVEIPFKKHSENLFPAIEKLLSENTVQIAEVDYFGVVVGPGSFTGIRIGLSVIKTFAYVFGRQVVAVNSLESMAYNNFGSTDVSTFWVAQDAGSGKVYAQRFGASAKPESNPKLFTLDEFAKIVNGLRVFSPTPDVFNSVGVLTEGLAQNPKALGELFKVKLEAREAFDYAQVNPLYLRLSQAELNIGLKEGHENE